MHVYKKKEEEEESILHSDVHQSLTSKMGTGQVTLVFPSKVNHFRIPPLVFQNTKSLLLDKNSEFVLVGLK